MKAFMDRMVVAVVLFFAQCMYRLGVTLNKVIEWRDRRRRRKLVAHDLRVMAARMGMSHGDTMVIHAAIRELERWS